MNDDIERGPGIKPMFLPDVEAGAKPSPCSDLIRGRQDRGLHFMPQRLPVLTEVPRRGCGGI